MEPVTIFTFFLEGIEVAEVMIPRHAVPVFLKAYKCGAFERMLAEHDRYDTLQAN